MGPHPGLPGMGPAGAGLLAFGAAGLGAAAGVPGAPGTPHSAAAVAAAAQAHPLLKPADLHSRGEPAELKGPASLVAEERLVSLPKNKAFYIMILRLVELFSLSCITLVQHIFKSQS